MNKHQHHRRSADEAAEWFAGRLPDAWFTGDPTVIVDREEITVIGRAPRGFRRRVHRTGLGRAAAVPRGDSW